jgi:uncharacterized protein (DUF2141 family)
MKIIRPIRTICDHIISSNVPLVEPLYNPATTYSKGNKVTDSPCGASVYESLANSNTGNPLTDATKWLPIGASNYYAMFDDKNGSQTTNPNTIEIEVEFFSLVNSVALINVEANTARFEAWDANDVKILDQTIQLRDYGRIDYYDYFTREIEFIDRYVSFDIPTIRQGRGKLTLSNTGLIAKLGGLIYGNQYAIGETQWGSSLGIRDFSTKEDDDFGNYVIVQRGFRDKIDADVFIQLNRVANVRKILTQYRATPVVWSGGDENNTLVTYGYYKDFSVILSTPAGADCAIQIEGLI